jgi:hypothetical protein
VPHAGEPVALPILFDELTAAEHVARKLTDALAAVREPEAYRE